MKIAIDWKRNHFWLWSKQKDRWKYAGQNFLWLYVCGFYLHHINNRGLKKNVQFFKGSLSVE